MTPEQSQLIRRTITRDLTSDEHALFLECAQRSGLDPFARHIYPQRRNGRLTFEATIDGLRLSAERTGRYAGQLGPEWCGADGIWRDIWTGNQPPVGARVGILRSDFRKPVWGKALYSEFVQLEHGEPTRFWRDMAANQLAKCAEALGFRKAFPREFSGLYTPDEMAQAQQVSATGSSLPFREQQPERGGGGMDTTAASKVPGSSAGLSSDIQLRNPEQGDAGTDVPLPLQPFFDQGLSDRRNLQAAYGFVQLELEHILGAEGLPVFRRIYARHMGHGLFTSRLKCEAANRACLIELWGAVEAAQQERRAA
jgi:phage recombination protein Bet